MPSLGRLLAVADVYAALNEDRPHSPARDGRYPAVLIHYQGNSSRSEKDLPLEVARGVCEEILDAGAVPIVLDWDNRTRRWAGRFA